MMAWIREQLLGLSRASFTLTAHSASIKAQEHDSLSLSFTSFLSFHFILLHYNVRKEREEWVTNEQPQCEEMKSGLFLFLHFHSFSHITL